MRGKLLGSIYTRIVTQSPRIQTATQTPANPCKLYIRYVSGILSMFKGLTFIAGSAVLVYFSRASLRAPGSHGFYRFFAWELILFLAASSLDRWEGAVHTSGQIASEVLMNISLILVIFGYLSLFLFGKHDARRNDAPLLLIEKTTTLVTRGMYRYIRHPIYSSLIFLDFGLFFKEISLLNGCIALVACLLLLFTSRAEENENLDYFGSQYQQYMARTKLFIPFLL